MKILLAARWWIAAAWIGALLAPFLIEEMPRQYVPWTGRIAPTILAYHAGITVLAAIASLFVERDVRGRLFNCLAVVWIADMLVMHQDFWFWTDKYLLFGIVPLGLAYHAGFTVLAAVTLFVFTRTIWPKHLEEEEQRLPPPGPGRGAH